MGKIENNLNILFIFQFEGKVTYRGGKSNKEKQWGIWEI